MYVCHLSDRKKKQYVVAAMGTARGRVGWPPKEIGKKSIQDVQYNSLYYNTNDKAGNY